MIRKFKSDRCYEHTDGEFVLYIDHEAAIAEVRRQERERCVAEIRVLARDFQQAGQWPQYAAVDYAAELLKKGLTQ